MQQTARFLRVPPSGETAVRSEDRPSDCSPHSRSEASTVHTASGERRPPHGRTIGRTPTLWSHVVRGGGAPKVGPPFRSRTSSRQVSAYDHHAFHEDAEPGDLSLPTVGPRGGGGRSPRTRSGPGRSERISFVRSSSYRLRCAQSTTETRAEAVCPPAIAVTVAVPADNPTPTKVKLARR